jgi:wyosine [tRNA(Phe)-imidazoG37] synthetase (radical SAM superfamily)
MEKRFFCDKPWRGPVEIRSNFGVYPCCQGWTEYSFGDWASDSFDAIWNGERAREFRRTILDGSYRLCKLKQCAYFGCNQSLYSEEEIKRFAEVVPPPKIVDFCHERVCNVRCVMCRDMHIHNNDEETRWLDSKIESVFLPWTANAELVIINGEGEALASKHCRKLIKTISEKNPLVKFSIRSNGILTDKKNFEELGILNKINVVIISLHAVKKSTYNHIVLDSDFSRIIKNVNWISSNKICNITLVSVISALNYREMPTFIRLAQNYSAKVCFYEYINFGNKMGQRYEQMAVFKEYHPRYNKYVKISNKIMNDERLRKSIASVSPLLFNLEPITVGQWLKYRIKNLKSQLKKMKDKKGWHLVYLVSRKGYRVLRDL